MTGIEMIARERQEQIEKHGFTIDHDLNINTNSELLKAAVYLITDDDDVFPDTWDKKVKQEFDEKTRLEQYIIAAALIAAHIDRMQAELKQK